ncbi:MAG TPA: hypothetical protein VGD69_25645 [Herpetosiphonaceae bacterium]
MLHRRLHPVIALTALVILCSLSVTQRPTAVRARPAAASAPQSSAAPIELVSSIGGVVAVLDMEGSLAYVNEGGALTIIDVGDPGQTSRRGYLPLPDSPISADVVSSTAYIAAADAGLQIVDVSNPDTPQVIGGYAFTGTTLDVEIVGGLAYVLAGHVTGYDAVYVLDISAPSQPVLRGKYDLPETPLDFEMAGSLAYMVFGYAGLQIVDLSNPASPVLRGSYPFPDYAHGVEVEGNRVYVGESGSPSEQNHLTILDVGNPASPTLLGRYNTAAFGIAYVEVEGNLAYLIDFDNTELWIVDVSNPASPSLRSKYDPSSYPEGVHVVGERAYLTVTDGLEIVDVSSPASPSLLGSYTRPHTVSRVDSVGSLVYIIGDGLQIVDASDLARPRLRGFYPGEFNDVQVVGNLAYLTTNQTFQIVDVSNPDTPTLRSSRSSNLWLKDILVRDNLAYIQGDSRLMIFDISDPSDPVALGSYDSPFIGGNGFDVVGDFAYLASVFCLRECRGGLEVVDVSDPFNLMLRGVYEQYALGVNVVDDRAYLIRGIAIEILDVSNPAQPTLSGSYRSPRFATRLQFQDGRAYIADGYLGGLHIADVIDADHLRARATYKTPGEARDLDVVDDIVYLADATGGLKIFRVHPELFPSDIFVPLVSQ